MLGVVVGFLLGAPLFSDVGSLASKEDDTGHQLSISKHEKVICVDGGKERCDSVLKPRE